MDRRISVFNNTSNDFQRKRKRKITKEELRKREESEGILHKRSNDTDDESIGSDDYAEFLQENCSDDTDDSDDSVLIDEVACQYKQVRYIDEKMIAWTVKLDKLGDEEFRLILPFLDLKALTKLKLASKRCELRVTKYDARVQKWHIRVISVKDTNYLLQNSQRKTIFQFVTLKFILDSCIHTKPKKQMLEVYNNKIVDLDIVIDGCDRYLSDYPIPNLTKLTVHCDQYGGNCEEEIEEEDLESDGEDSDGEEKISDEEEQGKSNKSNNDDTKSKDIDGAKSSKADAVGNLKEMIIKNCAPFLSEILNNRKVGETVTSLTIIPEEQTDFKIDVAFFKVEQLFMKNYSNFRWMILPRLHSLIVLGDCNIDINKIPMLPNLKVLMVDGFSVNLVNKCLSTLELLIFMSEQTFDEDMLVLDQLTFPKLKHLVFGGTCLPSVKFIMSHKNTLETVGMVSMPTVEEWDSFESFDSGHQEGSESQNRVLIKTLVKDFPCLKRLVLPADTDRVRDRAGRVKILYEAKEAVRALKSICRSQYKLLDDRFCDTIYEIPYY